MTNATTTLTLTEATVHADDVSIGALRSRERVPVTEPSLIEDRTVSRTLLHSRYGALLHALATR